MTQNIIRAAALLKTFSAVFLAASAASLISGVIIFFRFKIPKVIGDLSGHATKKTARKFRAGDKQNLKHARKKERKSTADETKELAENDNPEPVNATVLISADEFISEQPQDDPGRLKRKQY